MTGDTAAKDVWPFRVCTACGSVREGKGIPECLGHWSHSLGGGLNPGDSLLGMWGNVT